MDRLDTWGTRLAWAFVAFGAVWFITRAML